MSRTHQMLSIVTVVAMSSTAALAGKNATSPLKIQDRGNSRFTPGIFDPAAPGGIQPAVDASVDIDLSGFQAFGDFDEPSNSSVLVDVLPNAYITGVSYNNLQYTSYSPSYEADFAISTDRSDNTGAAGTFWDYAPSSTLAPGNFSGSGSFTNPSNLYNSGPYQLGADGKLLVYVYDTFPDGASPADETVTAGTLHVTYSDTAPPPPPPPTTLYTGDLSATDPTFNRPSSLSTISGVGTDVSYDVQGITVSADGTYTLQQTSTDIDSYLLVYAGSFDPNDPLANLIALNDDGTTIGDSSLNVALTAGTQYYIVDTSFDNGEVGAYTVLGAGPGVINLSVSPEPVTLLSFAGMSMFVIQRRRSTLKAA